MGKEGRSERESRDKGEELRYGARWAERPAKNRVDELPPEGANTTEACYCPEGLQRGDEILIVPLRRAEKEVADESFGENMAESGLLEFVG